MHEHTHISDLCHTNKYVCVRFCPNRGRQAAAGPVLLHKHRVLQQHQEDEELTRLSSVVSAATHSTEERAGLLQNPK
jgi:hypothetical protein